MASYAIANRGESDEEFARRLYSQELGITDTPAAATTAVTNVPPPLVSTNL